MLSYLKYFHNIRAKYMKNKSIEVKKGEFVVIKQGDGTSVALAMDLNSDIAFTFSIKNYGCAGLARSLEIHKIKELFDGYDLNKITGKILIKIVGGDCSTEAVKYVKDLLCTFKQIEGSRSIFEISENTNESIHPNFCVLLGEEVQ